MTSSSAKPSHYTDNFEDLAKEILVSYDVVSLLTKAPINEGCNIIKTKLNNEKMLEKRTRNIQI